MLVLMLDHRLRRRPNVVQSVKVSIKFETSFIIINLMRIDEKSNLPVAGAKSIIG